MLNEEYNIQRVKYRIKRLNRLKEHYEKDIEIGILSAHGYEMYGYYKGILSELENMLDILQQGD